MIKSRLSESIIKEKINSSVPNFDLSVDGLINLKNNNVDNSIIDLIIQKQKTFEASKSIVQNESLIEYRVTSSSPEDVLILNYRDSNEDFKGTTGSSGWVYSFKTVKKPFTALLSAVLLTTKSSKVTLKIIVNGHEVKTFQGTLKGTPAGEGPKQIQFVIE